MMYKVEKNIPMPQFTNRSGPIALYPFCDMKLGDSFVIPRPDGLINGKKLGTAEYLNKTKNKVSNAATKYRQSHNSKARFLCDFDSNSTGVRVWRIV